MAVPFNDLRRVASQLADELKAAMDRVLASGWYLLGPELEAFEQEFAAWAARRHAVGVANGTDALELALRALDIGAGDEVVTVSHTAVATVCAIERAGATPVLCDIEEGSYTASPDAIDAAISSRTRALVVVHLYGQAADMAPIAATAERHGLALVEDCAQAHGARYRGAPVGTFGVLAAFSFYPTKNLGALGDAGAVVTDDPSLAERLRRLRNYGQRDRYHHVERGQNSRLDEIQAALLRVKLRQLAHHNATRRALAEVYLSRLEGVSLPVIRPECEHVFHLFVVRHPRRDELQRALAERGVGTLVHYPVPIHLQPAYRSLGLGAGALPRTESAARQIVSLPLFVGLREDEQLEVCQAIGECVRELGPAD